MVPIPPCSELDDQQKLLIATSNEQCSLTLRVVQRRGEFVNGSNRLTIDGRDGVARAQAKLPSATTLFHVGNPHTAAARALDLRAFELRNLRLSAGFVFELGL